MKKEYIYSHIRHIAIRCFFLALIPLLILIILAIKIPFHDVFFPSTLSYANSAQTKYNSGKEYIEITLNNACYTGYDCIRHGKIYGSYYYSLVNNQCTFILVKTDSMDEIPSVLNDYTIKAKLVNSDNNIKDMLKTFSEDIGWTYEGLNSVTSPIIIDETKYILPVISYLAVALSIFALFVIAFIIVNIIYFVFPGAYPACLYFSRLTKGHHQLNKVNYELNNKVVMHSGNITLTQNYIITSNPFVIEIIPINKIVWAYEHITWRRFLWIKFKLNYTLNIVCKKKIHAFSPRNKKEDVDAVLKFLQDNKPEIIFGYSKENKKLAQSKMS